MIGQLVQQGDRYFGPGRKIHPAPKKNTEKNMTVELDADHSPHSLCGFRDPCAGPNEICVFGNSDFEGGGNVV